MGCSSSKEDNVQEPEPEKKKKSKKDKKDKNEDKNEDKKDETKNSEKDKKKKKKKNKEKETIEDPPKIEEENQQGGAAGAPAGGAGNASAAQYPELDVNATDFAPANDPTQLQSTESILNANHLHQQETVNPEKYTGADPLYTPASTIPPSRGRPQTSPEDVQNLQEMQQMKLNLDALQTQQSQQAEENAKLLQVLMKMDKDQKQNAVQHADALQKQKEDYEKILNGNQEEIRKLQLEQQKELQQFQEQQLANAQNQQKPTTAVSVRPQTFQTDPGTSVSQRPPVPKTPGMMPPGTAATTALMEHATKEEIAARFIVMRQIAAQRKKENQKLRDQFLEVLAQQRNQPAIRPNTSASVIMAKRVNDQQVQRMEKIISEQDTIISKLEHLLGRADVQPDNAFKSQIDELYQLTQQRQRFFLSRASEQQALPMGYQTHAAGHEQQRAAPVFANPPVTTYVAPQLNYGAAFERLPSYPILAARSVRSLPAPQPSKMEELFEKEQRKNEKLEQQMNLERREADYNKQMAERELALVQNQLRLQQGAAFQAPYPGAQAGPAWGGHPAPQGALPPVGYPTGYPPRPY